MYQEMIQRGLVLALVVPQLVLAHVSPQDQGMKSPSAVSSQWGSYFVDVQKGEDDDEERQKVTWCCHCIHTYSTMAIPSVEHIAGVCPHA